MATVENSQVVTELTRLVTNVTPEHIHCISNKAGGVLCEVRAVKFPTRRDSAVLVLLVTHGHAKLPRCFGLF